MRELLSVVLRHPVCGGFFVFVFFYSSPRKLNTVEISNTSGRVSRLLGCVSDKTGSVAKKEEKSETHQFSQIGPQGFKVVRKSFNFVRKGLRQKGRVSSTSRRAQRFQ